MSFWKLREGKPERSLDSRYFEQRYSFDDLHRVLISKGNLNFIIVTGHNTARGGEEQGIPQEAHHIRGGNFSDLYFLPLLISDFVIRLCKRCGDRYPAAADLDIKMIPIIYLDIADVKEYNLILIGAGNANWVIEYIFEKYWGESELLPIHFKSIGSHEIIVSELSRREYSVSRVAGKIDTDYAILEVVPNPWNVDKVAILCCGIDFWGTQAAILALARRKDSRDRELVNNRGYPAKVLSVKLRPKEFSNFKDVSLTLQMLGEFTFEE